MTGAQLDAMKGAEDARIWAAMNKEDRNAKAAIAQMRKAVHALMDAEECLQLAAGYVANTPDADRIASLDADAGRLEVDMWLQLRRMF